VEVHNLITPRNRSVAETIFENLENNEYLIELYDELLKAYTRKLFNRSNPDFTYKKFNDLLSFADLLSKSTGTKNSDLHKIWSQQIIALLEKLYPKNNRIYLLKYSILISCSNFLGLKTAELDYNSTSVFDQLIELSNKEYYSVPYSENDYFFEDQKSIFDGFSHQYFSFSAPTSLGKSFVMRVFIKQKIIQNCSDDFAIIVPTKALINETKTKILNDLGQQLMKDKNYKVVVSANDMVLERNHCFIYIMTPERFLYLLNTTSKRVSFLFIDEAHKISTKDTRSPFYYDLVSKISSVNPKPHIIFSSPNIPNPEEYLKLVQDPEGKSNQRSIYSPVCQMKYLVDLKDGVVKAFDDYSKSFIKMGNSSSNLTLNSLIHHVAGSDEQNIIYCSTLRETIEQAIDFAENHIPSLTTDQQNELNKLSNDIKNEINVDYFLVDLVKKGVAFHVGYLPAGIRKRIEDAFKKGSIKTLFCTSTLIEGVNLPADNLFITSYKNGRNNLDKVSFRNLIGRVGRIDNSLFGNVFMVCLSDSSKATIDKYEDLLTNEIPNQTLSIESFLTNSQKRAIIDGLLNNDFEMTSKNDKTTSDEFNFMRKKALIFINDLRDNKDSLIVQELRKYATQEQIEVIKKNIQKLEPNKGIDVSPDQFWNLKDFIASGEKYPDLLPDGKVDYIAAVDFIKRLGSVFKWHVYERKTLGYVDKTTSNLSHISWYANILYKWMSGYGLSYIIKGAIQYKEDYPETGIWANNWKIEDYYDKKNPKHKNLIIADTLNTIENIILFRVANYFREFSTEYKLHHNKKVIDNDWYEYVEYGTTDSLTILLQRYGYHREAAQYIIKNQEKYVNFELKTDLAPFALRKNLLANCSDENTKSETTEIFINIPELFIEE
jgi:replicative superfamily II helicase